MGVVHKLFNMTRVNISIAPMSDCGIFHKSIPVCCHIMLCETTEEKYSSTQKEIKVGEIQPGYSII